MKERSYPNKYLRHLFSFFLVIALLPACIIVVEEEDDDDDYYRRRWFLEVIYYGNTMYQPDDGDVYTVAFSSNEVLSGQADCVRFEGQYKVGRTSTLSIKELSSDGDACGVDSIASIYLNELAKAQSMSGSAEELVIQLEGSDNRMKFRSE